MRAQHTGTRAAGARQKKKTNANAADTLLNNIHMLMSKNGCTIEEIAKLLQVSPSTVYNRFCKPWTFTVKEVVLLAVAFDVEPAALLAEQKFTWERERGTAE